MADLLEVNEEQALAAFNGGCEECVATGGTWKNLRICLQCGRVGCCDSSPGTHATKHWQETGHSVVRSVMPGEDWRFDYATDSMVD